MTVGTVPAPGDEVRVCDGGDAVAKGPLDEIHDLGRGHWLIRIGDWWVEVDEFVPHPYLPDEFDAVVS